jgi:hypothetical protein
MPLWIFDDDLHYMHNSLLDKLLHTSLDISDIRVYK